MAFPILPLMIFVMIIVLAAWKRQLFFKLLVEIAVDIGLGIVLTMIFYLIYRIPTPYIVYVVLLIAGIFFVMHLFTSSKSKESLLMQR